jgi:hypothetical protein
MNNAVVLTKLAAAKAPNFIILGTHCSVSSCFIHLLGGDLAYENSICSCYDIFDNFFDVIINNLVYASFIHFIVIYLRFSTPGGDLIPIIPVIGNHDSGGYFISSPKNIKFYLNFFPVVNFTNGMMRLHFFFR